MGFEGLEDGYEGGQASGVLNDNRWRIRRGPDDIASRLSSGGSNTADVVDVRRKKGRCHRGISKALSMSGFARIDDLTL